jgi:hypothetical protein
MKTTTYFQGYGSGQVPRQGTSRQSGSGGGARFTERAAPKAEPRARAVSVPAVSRQGTAQGTHVTGGGGREVRGAVTTSLYAGPGYQGGPVGPRPTVEGPGGGRTVMPCGTEGQHGPAAGQPFQPSHRGWEYPGK